MAISTGDLGQKMTIGTHFMVWLHIKNKTSSMIYDIADQSLDPEEEPYPFEEQRLLRGVIFESTER